MRLIDTTTRKLCWFDPRNVPEYAILSHTWGPEESTLQEFSASKKKSKAGYKKIIRAIKMAWSEQHRFIWIDSCCIDRTNPTEINEAISSMYAWYANSKVCYVFLDDLSKKAPTSQLTNCRWFTRGWTLQELVASRNVRFYDVNGVLRGTKQILVDAISKRTNIPQPVLLNLIRPSDFPVACIMSWAANRETTKIEDEAYCLVGLFGIHLNVVYGEGQKAFRRLQEEILLRRGDLTQLAWSLPTTQYPQALPTNGAQPSYQKLRNVLIQPRPILPCLFAPSADCFSNSSSLFPFVTDIANYKLTNRGLYVAGPLALRIYETRSPAGQGPSLSHYMILVGKQGDNYIGISLLKIGPDLFCRNWDMGLARLKGDEVSNLRQILVPSWYIVVDHEGVNAATATIYRDMCVHFPAKGAANEFVQIRDIVPNSLWDVHDRVFLRPNTYRGGKYDMVLGLKLYVPMSTGPRTVHGKSSQLSKGLEFVVLCKFRQRQDLPQCFVLTAEKYPREVKSIFTPRPPNASFIWPDLEMAFPHLMGVSDNAVVPFRSFDGAEILYRVSAKVVLENARLVSQAAPVFSIYLDINQWQPNTLSRTR